MLAKGPPPCADRTARAAPPRARVRPLLERLEGRDAPAVLTVTNLSDHDPGSLRDRIAAASSGDTVQFAVGGTITLTTGELLLNKDLSIEGPGADLLSISGNHASRVFEVAAGHTVGLSELTVTDGRVTGTNDGGGILNNGGTLSVTGSTVAGNSATQNGGGIYNSGTLSVTGSVVAGNSAILEGGGIHNYGSEAARLSSTIVAGNIRGPGGPADDIYLLQANPLDAASSYNLIGTGGSGGLADGVNHNQVGVASPGLGTLGYYGGPTQTIPLLPGSPAIGSGDPSLAGTPDQRSIVRYPVPSVGAFEYVPGDAAYLIVTAPATVTAGVPFLVTVAAVTADGSPATGYTGRLVLQSTDPQAGDLGEYEMTGADGGTHTFTVTLYTAPAQLLLAHTAPFDGVAGVTVQPAAPAFLYLVPDSYVVSAGSAFTVTAYLYDAYGNAATNSTGVLHFAGTDPAAALPDDYTFTADDAGTHAFTLTLNTAGPVSVTASVVGSPDVTFELDLTIA